MHDFNEFSNHTPISLSIKTQTSHDDSVYNDTHITYRWNPVHRDKFRNELNANIIELEQKLLDFADNNVNPDIMVQTFTEYLNVRGNKYFERKYSKNSSKFENSDKNKQDWYDATCREKRNNVHLALDIFLKDKNDINRQALYELKKDYKYYCRKQKTLFNRQLSRKMNDMRRLKPRDFWNQFKQAKVNPTGDNVSNDEFCMHFKNLANTINGKENVEVSEFLENFDTRDFNNSESTCPELDEPITLDEIVAASKRLGNNKACSLDCIIYEYFKECMDILGKPLEIMFNYTLNSNTFPNSWSVGVIKPLYKKGDPSDANNYRGITITSCFCKLFTVIVNERLKKWSITNQVITDAQFGFKANFGTVDSIFVLNSLLETQLRKKGKLYTCLVDFRKPYDYIDRSSLWFTI